MGQFGYLKPADPETFAASIARVLSGYPLAVVQECCDPAFGLVRETKYLEVHDLVKWCDAKLNQYRAWATTNTEGWQRYLMRDYQPEFSDEHCAEMRERISKIPGTYFRGDA